MKSELLVLVLSTAFGFIASFGGAHLLTDVLTPQPGESLDVVLLLLGQLATGGH